MNVIGIDPGVSGGMAIVYMTGAIDTLKFKNSTEVDIAEWLERCNRNCILSAAFIERVASTPQMGVVSAFTFGRSYGFLRGAISAFGIPFEEVSPQKWQKAMGCLSKGNKNVTKARCQQLFPQVKATHAIADAVLIAEYGRRLVNQRNGNTNT